MKKLLYLFLVLFIIGLVVGIYGYTLIFNSNVEVTDKSEYLHIPTGTSFEKLSKILEQDYGVDRSSFDLVSQLMKFDTPKSGRYKLVDGWSNKQLISALRRGDQSALSLTFNNARNIEQLSGMMASKLEPDSLSFLKHFTSEESLAKYGLDLPTVLTLFIPNTYQIYWNSSPEAVLSRFASCLLYTSPSPRDATLSRMPSSA